MKKLELTAIIFSSNSEADIARSIHSVDLADEVIVFDSGSTDDSVKIAKKLVKKVIESAYLPYVEPQREMALAHATHEWVLFLDADEEAPENLEILFTQAQDKNAVLNIPRKNIIFNTWIKHSGYWPDRHPRLFKKESIRWHKEIHSKPTIYTSAIDVPADEKNALIHHHYSSISQWVKRMDRYTNVKVEEIKHEKFVWNDILTKPLAEFLRRYFAWEGYKDGLHGLVIALLDGFYACILSLKHWETKKFIEPNDQIGLRQIENEFSGARKELNYWFGEIAVKSARNGGEKMLRKVKRKLGI